MDPSEIEANRNIIYLTEEERKNDWTYDATKEMLKIYDEKCDLFDSGIIPTQKKLWQLTSKAMLDKGLYYTAAQCENKWKVLKRGYKTKMERVQRFGSTKRACPFEYEVAEIISKRSNDSYYRSHRAKVDELRKQDDLFKINLNEPPGFTKEKTPVSNTNVKEELESENDEPSYTVVQDNSQSVLIEEICDLKSILVKHNKVTTHLSRQTVECHERILNCLERGVEGQTEARQIEEMKVKQQEETVQQMKLQNELLQKLLEKLS